MCKNTDINKEFFDVIIRLKRQSHANIKLKDLYASELMGLRIIYKLKMMQDDNSIGVKTSDIGNYLFMKKSATSKMLNNLEDKGYIKVEKRGRKAYINALIDETTYKTEKAASMLDEWFDGSAKELFSALNQKIPKEDQESLKDMLDEMDFK